MEIIREIMLNLIVNPNSGKGLAINNIKIITKYLKKEKVPYLVYFSEKESDIADYAVNLFKSGERDFVIVGGDGSIHKMVNSLPELSKVNLGIIPSGVYNNFAKSLNLEFNPVKAIQNILNNKIEKFDYLKCGELLIINYIAFGAVEEIKHKYKCDSEKRKPKFFDYLNNLKKYEPLQVNFTNKEIKEKSVVINECYICNGMYKGKSCVSPLSNTQDGLCNVICITRKDKGQLKEYLKIKNGKHIYDNLNKVYWLESVNLTSSNSPIKAEIDGELYELENLSVNVIQGGLNIFVE